MNPDGSCAKCGNIHDGLVFGLLIGCVAGVAIMVVCVRVLIARLMRIYLASNEDVWEALAQNSGDDLEDNNGDADDSGSNNNRRDQDIDGSFDFISS